MRSRIWRRFGLIVFLTSAVSLHYSLANAQTLEKLRVAYTVIAPTQANVWTAKEMGFYAKHGLDADLVLLVGAPLARHGPGIG